MTASEIITIFGWEYSTALAGYVWPLIGLGILGGAAIGLIAGIALPYCLSHFRKRRKQARQTTLPNDLSAAEHTWPPAPKR